MLLCPFPESLRSERVEPMDSTGLQVVLASSLSLLAACHAVPRSASSDPLRPALIAVSEHVLRGRLELVSPYPPYIWRVKVGDVQAFVGGSGQELPDDTERMLSRLQGSDVIAGVHPARFQSGEVLVVTCFGRRLALGPEQEFADVAARREALLACDDWLERGRALETGSWSRFLASLENLPAETHDALLQEFLASARPCDLARDIAGWWVRTIGADPVIRRGGRLIIGTYEVREIDREVRTVAKRIVEYALRLPEGLLSWRRAEDPEMARRVWMIVEMTTGP